MYIPPRERERHHYALLRSQPGDGDGEIVVRSVVRSFPGDLLLGCIPKAGIDRESPEEEGLKSSVPLMLPLSLPESFGAPVLQPLILEPCYQEGSESSQSIGLGSPLNCPPPK